LTHIREVEEKEVLLQGEQTKAEAAFKRGYANIKPPFGAEVENRSVFCSQFPDVCPKPVLANDRFSSESCTEKHCLVSAGVWTETPTGGTVNFITGAGGFLQSVLFGYGGLRLREGRLDIQVPPLPSNTTSLTLNGVHYRGSKLRLSITPAEVSISVLEVEATATLTALGQAGGGGLELCRGSGSGSKVQPLTVGKVYEIGRSEGASIRPSGTCGALPAQL
jgi:hypothetical protein